MMLASKAKATRPSDKYTAVIFVHGMGRQSQYENLGRLLEALEEHCTDPETGVLRQFDSRTEPSRSGSTDDVPFVQFDRFTARRIVPDAARDTRWRFTGRYRAYEAFWSPLTARGAHPLRVAVWTLRQFSKPEATGEATWRQFTHLRLARLHRLIATWPRPADPALARRRDYLAASLMAHIKRFRGHEGARLQAMAAEGAAGEAEFDLFARMKLGPGVRADELRDIISRWGRTRLPVEDLARTMSRRLKLIGLAVIVFVASLAIDIWRDGLTASALAGLASLASVVAPTLWFGGRFLARTFSDVYIWNSNQAHDRDHGRRREVLADTRALFEHVALDPACKRIVIVAHSLGTPITLETLALIGRRNVARADGGHIVPMGKLSHLVTLGSPIDKIFYFFQTRQAETYRAGRLLDDLRGTLSQEPFFRGGRPRVDWLNFWDRADIVSDPLYAPQGSDTNGAEHLSAGIDNLEVENGRTFSAWKTHVGYLENHNVVDCIAEALFRNETTWPSSRPSRRDPAVSGARTFALSWTPAALLAGAVAAACGWGLLGVFVATGPLAYLAVVISLVEARRQRLTRLVRRARL